MNKINTGLIKDFIISLLIIISILLILSIIFYDKISLSKIVPESQDYMVSDEMQEDIDKTLSEEGSEILTTYYIDAADLKKYEKTKEYNKGKKNPFAVEMGTSVDNTVSNTNNNNISQDKQEESSNYFYEDDGTK